MFGIQVWVSLSLLLSSQFSRAAELLLLLLLGTEPSNFWNVLEAGDQVED